MRICHWLSFHVFCCMYMMYENELGITRSAVFYGCSRAKRVGKENPLLGTFLLPPWWWKTPVLVGLAAEIISVARWAMWPWCHSPEVPTGKQRLLVREALSKTAPSGTPSSPDEGIFGFSSYRGHKLQLEGKVLHWLAGKVHGWDTRNCERSPHMPEKHAGGGWEAVRCGSSRSVSFFVGFFSTAVSNERHFMAAPAVKDLTLPPLNIHRCDC